jgi:hypothetical protein
VTVIARYSAWKGYSYAAGLLLAYILAGVLFLSHPTGTTWWGYAEARGRPFHLLIVLFIALPLALLTQIVMLVQLLFHRRRAVWVEGQKLIFLNGYGFFPVKQTWSAIASLSVGDIGYFRRGVLATLKNGSKLSIPTWLLEDSPETVLERLKAASPG